VTEEAGELAAGTLDPEGACMAGLFPEALLRATDAVLDPFEGELPGLGSGLGPDRGAAAPWAGQGIAPRAHLGVE